MNMKGKYIKKININKYNTFRAAMYMLSTLWKKDKVFVIIKFVNVIISSLLTLPYIVIPGLIINELILMKLSKQLLWYVLIIIFTPLISAILNRIFSTYFTKATDRLLVSLEVDLYYHITNLDYEVLEDPELQTLQERAQSANEKTLIIVDQLCGLVFSSIKLFSLTTIIVSMNLLIIIPIILFTIFLF